MSPASKWVVLVVAAIVGVPAAAQRFETGATAVVVDVVVRDNGGRFVTGLTPADFTVAEDGVPQRITSLQLVGTPTPERATPTTPGSLPGVSAAATRGGDAQPRFTALVFDRLETGSINIAKAGAVAAVADAGRSDVIAVFLVDKSLVMVQPFTSDKARLTAAVDDAVQWSAGLITRNASGKRYDGGDTPGSAPGAEFAGDIDANGMLQVSTNVWEVLDRQFQGHATTDALLTATAALSTLPGRKTLLYFSDAIAIPDTVLPKLNDVVATANRGQVTIYAIDTAGLRIGSQEAMTRGEIVAMGSSGLAINADGSNSSTLKMMERNEDVLRRAPRVGLTMLSKPTGGFLIESTNDLAAGVRRIDADRRVHYLLTYQPTRSDLDGTWRAIDVKVARRDTTVQARQGYVAVKSPGVLPVLVYEGPALAAVDRTPTPREIPTRAGAFAFPRIAAAKPGEPIVEDVTVVVAAPAAPLTFEVKGSSYRTDFTMLALMRNQDGVPIHKTSQPYRLTGRAAERDKARSTEVRFARTLPTPPGAYTLWGAVHDTASRQAGVAPWRFQVEGRGPTGLGVSSLVLLSRLERVTTPHPPGDPLVVGDRLITPNLGEAMYQKPDARLGFYFVVAGADPGERVQARLQFYQDGIPEPKALLLEAQVPVEPADGRGVVRPLGALPLAGLPLGSLEARLILERFGQQDVRSAFFRLEDPRSEGRVP